MKFRQRVSWLVVVIYLSGTFAFFYYLFEINDHYNQFAVDHVQRFHTQVSNEVAPDPPHTEALLSRLWGHITDIPLPVWMLIFLLPYLQIFMMILACTRAEPKLSMAFTWPAYVYVGLKKLCKNCSNSTIPTTVHRKSSNGSPNGYNVLHT